MIRPLDPETDAAEITEIYNRYVLETDISFETLPLDPEQMRGRLEVFAASYPCFVAVDGEGRVEGYCYAHPWKERAAYAPTLETTVYLAPGACGRGVGRRLMEALTDECRRRGFHSLIACITASNTASRRFHERLGFRQVSEFVAVGLKLGRRPDVTDYQLIL